MVPTAVAGRAVTAAGEAVGPSERQEAVALVAAFVSEVPVSVATEQGFIS